MTDQEILEKMKDKKFFKKAAKEKGLIDFFFSHFKRYSSTTAHSIHEPIQLAYYKPEDEGTDEGFGDYGIYALPLNNEGKSEIDGIAAALKENGLMDNIGKIRYNSRGNFINIEPTEGELENGFGQYRKFSTENTLVYAFTTNHKEGVDIFDRAIFCKCADNKRYIQIISTSGIRSAQ